MGPNMTATHPQNALEQLTTASAHANREVGPSSPSVSDHTQDAQDQISSVVSSQGAQGALNGGDLDASQVYMGDFISMSTRDPMVRPASGYPPMPPVLILWQVSTSRLDHGTPHLSIAQSGPDGFTAGTPSTESARLPITGNVETRDGLNTNTAHVSVKPAESI